MIIIILLILIVIVLGCNYYVHYGRNGRLINLIPGPSGYPICGNVFSFLDSPEKIWETLALLINQYNPIFKVWEFFLPVVIIHHPDDLKTILSTMNHIEKSFLYDIFHPWLGKNNLFTSEGPKWHSQRKLALPAFQQLQQFVDILIEEGQNTIKSLKNTENTDVKDLVSFVSEYTLNALCETAMGISLRNLGEFQEQYRKAVHQIGNLLVYRLSRQWLRNDWIFSFTSKGKEQAKVLKILHGFIEQIIAERKLYHERTNGRFLIKDFKNISSAKINDVETTKIQKRQPKFLDFLISVNREGLLTDVELKDSINGLIFAGHDTSAMALSYLIMLLAEHKDIQDRVRKEIDMIMRENEGKLNMKSLQDLSYLDRCVKETLRLYPSAFVISRITGKDVKLQSYLVPAGTTMLLHIFAAHRNPNFWPNPEVFDPDRFLPERIRNRHPYSYLPFSAGPRNCLGQRYGMLQIKAMIVPLLHNFYLEPIDYLKNIQMQVGVLLRPTHPLRIKFIPIYK